MGNNQPNKYRKFMIGAASAALVATAVAPVASAAQFTDVKEGNTHAPAINALVEAGVISGYPDGTFQPNKTLTRSDVVKMMGKWLESLDYKVPADYKTNPRFKDLTSKSNDELLKYAALVKDNGVFNGYADGTLGAGLDITRENMAIVLVRAYDAIHKTDLVTLVKETEFDKDVTDLAKAKAEARPYIDVLDYFDITNPVAPQFNPKSTTTRGQFASFLYKTSIVKVGEDTEAPKLVYTGEKTLNVQYDAKFTLPVVTATDNVDKNVKVTSVITNEAGEKLAEIDTKESGTYKVTYSAVDAAGNNAEDLVLTIVVAENPVPEVVSVSAVNPTEVLVKTSSKLSQESAEDVANYSVFINGSTTTDTIVDAKLQEDGKSVLVRFTTPVPNGQTLVVKTSKNLLTNTYASLAPYTSEAVIFQDKVAPKLVGVSYNGTNVVAEFSEPVTSVENVRVNGVQATFGSAVNATEAGNYAYVITGAPATPGNHSVVLTDVKDANNNNSGTLTASYKVVADASAPSVSKIEAVSDNSFKVTFNKAIESFTKAANHVVVKKGANTIDNARVTAVLATDGKSVTFTITAADTQLPLYGSNETSAALNVSFDNYKDVNGLLGSPYSSSITLTKDTNAPTILSKNLVKVNADKTVITIPYTEAVDAVAAKNAEIVIKKDGIIQSSMEKPTVAGVAGDASEKTVTLTFDSALADGVYTFDLPKGLVKDKTLNDSAADSITVTVSSAATYVVPTVTAPTDNTNVIKVTATEDFTDTAKVLSNYKLDDAALPAGTTIDFVDDKKNVLIKLPSTFPVVADANYKLEISQNVQTTSGAVVAAHGTNGGTFTKLVGLNDNVAPELSRVEVVKHTTETTKFNTLKLTFSENLAAVEDNAATRADFKVLINGSAVAVNAVTDGTPGDKVVTLVVGNGTELFNVSQSVSVTVVPVGTDNPAVDVKDAGFNLLKTGTTVTAQ